ncbi:MAG: C40 family peptidase [Candidatus Kapaibacteriota bacterium]
MNQNRYILILLFVLAILAGCQSLHVATTGKKHSMPEYVIPEYLEPIRKTALEEALRYVGTPYCYGGKSPFCTDCSGFVLQVYRTIGIKTPRTANDQYLAYASEDVIPEPGDLIFFRYAEKGNIAHVGIYAGEDFMIHASEKKGVVLSTLTYMRKHIVGYGRMPIQELSAK